MWGEIDNRAFGTTFSPSFSEYHHGFSERNLREMSRPLNNELASKDFERNKSSFSQDLRQKHSDSRRKK
ncbi:MAG: hypothetical protein B7Y25_05290 [Alphaproteobacteria bacterium 16-39-46]|nr:MAG: hypothetical protein B7Y25_05290 [Alphaproteobacteria bacterium 16-39-46]OZA42686.1 MAG: hypothetical protein B7X84_05190 [Alphaproteobacteria bacterium 17-39-52]